MYVDTCLQMVKELKPTQKIIPSFIYRIINSGPNRRHIEIPSRDRQQFENVGVVAVIPCFRTIAYKLEIKTSNAFFALARPEASPHTPSSNSLLAATSI